MRPEVGKLLLDICEAGAAIRRFVVGKTATDFATDAMLRSAIYYQFVVIGEALSQLRNLDEALVGRISEHWRIIGFRNQIVHGYSKIDDEITWRIVHDKLPVLLEEVDDLLRS